MRRVSGISESIGRHGLVILGKTTTCEPKYLAYCACGWSLVVMDTDAVEPLENLRARHMEHRRVVEDVAAEVGE